MINLLITSELKNRKPLNTERLSEYIEQLSGFKYPACKFPYNIIQNNPIYINYSLEENLEYFNIWLSALYNNIYTQDEINVLKLYTVLTYDNIPFYLSDSSMKLIEPYLETHFEKEEIEFFLDELRYNYLGTLLYNNSLEVETINNLISHLQNIEQEHNIFQMRMEMRYDESE